MGDRPLKRDDLTFGFECPVDLELGSGRTTHCSECDKHIWDVSKLTRAEFEALPKTACVVVSYDDDGVVAFAPEPPARSRLRNAAAAGLMGLLLAGCQPSDPQPKTEPSPVKRSVPTSERPIELNEPTATIPKKVSRAMLLEIHREMYGEYPDANTVAEPPPRTDRRGEFTGGNYRDIVQQKRNIREKRKKNPPVKYTMGIIRGDPTAE